MTGAGRGHRVLPHTADIRIRAWAPTREECIAEAVTGLVRSFVEPAGDRPAWAVDAELVAESDQDALVAALDEVIYVLDTQGGVPVEASVDRPADGRWRLRLLVAAVDDMPRVGAVPKAITWHGLRFGCTDGAWSCEVLVDV